MKVNITKVAWFFWIIAITVNITVSYYSEWFWEKTIPLAFINLGVFVVILLLILLLKNDKRADSDSADPST